MRHVLQHAHGCTTHAYKGTNPLATLQICATLLRVNTTLCECSEDPMQPFDSPSVASEF